MSDDYATLARIEDHLRRIADALEARPRYNPGGYVGGDYVIPEMPIRGGDRVITRHDLRPGERRWDDCETRGPNQCDAGCVRPSLHDGDCRGSVGGAMASDRRE